MSAVLETLVASRPSIEIDGQPADWPEAALTQLVATESDNGLASLEVTLANWGVGDRGAGLLFDNDTRVALGRRIVIAFGRADVQRVVFDGRVHALEATFSTDGPPGLVILAEDRLADLRLVRRTRVYENAKASEVCAAIAQANSLRYTGPAFGETGNWLQLGETDLALLRRVARPHGLVVCTSGDELKLERGADASGTPIALEMHADLVALRVLADVAHQRSSVRVRGFNAGAGEAFDVNIDRPGSFPGKGRSGPQWLRDAIGERTDVMSHHAARNEAEARLLAQAALDARCVRFVRAHGIALGRPDLRVGAELELSGIGRFANTYTLAHCEHRFDLRRGYVTQFEAGCAWLAEGDR